MDKPLVNHISRGSWFKRKWFSLLSGSDPPSACLLGLFRMCMDLGASHIASHVKTLMKTKIKKVSVGVAPRPHKRMCVLTCRINHTRVLYVRGQREKKQYI